MVQNKYRNVAAAERRGEMSNSLILAIQFFLFERGKECFRNSIELPCFVLCVMIKADEAEGLSALLDDDW